MAKCVCKVIWGGKGGDFLLQQSRHVKKNVFRELGAF